MTRFALRSIAVAGAVLLAAAAAAVWITATESGLHAAWRVAAPFLPAELSVGRLDGRLVGPVVLRDIRYDRPDLHVTIERVELEWLPAALLSGTLSIERLLARGIDAVRRAAPEAPPAADSPPWRPPERFSLPVAVSIPRVELDDVRVRPAPDAEPIVADAVRVMLSFRDSALAISDVEVIGPLFDVRGHAALEAYGRYETDLDLAFRFRPSGRPEAAGSLAASGGLDQLDVRLRVEAPYAIEADLLAIDVLEQPALDGALRVRIEPASIGVQAPLSEASADLTVAGELDNLALDGRVEVVVPDLAEARIDLAGRWQGSALELDALDISDRNSPAAVSLAGRVALEPSLFANLSGEWRDLAWPLQGEPAIESRRGDISLTGTLEELTAYLSAEIGPAGRVDGRVARSAERFNAELAWQDLVWPRTDPRLGSARGRLDASGTFDAYRFMLDADLAAFEQPASAEGHIVAEGGGNSSSLELERLDVAVLDGALEGSARVAWAPSLEGRVDLELARLDPSVLLPSWPGRLDGRLRASTNVDDERISADVEHLELTGALRGRNVEVDARGAYRDQSDAAIERLRVRSGNSRLSLEGRIGRALELVWEIDSPDLSDFWPGFRGRLESSGSAEGPLMRPIVTARAVGDGVAFDGAAVERMRLDARFDTAGNVESDVRLELQNARVAGREIERLDVQGSGTADAHRASAALVAEGAAVELALSGALARPWQPDYEWRFELEEGRVGYGDLAEWRLESPATGALSADGAELAEACWRSDEAALCVDASRRAADTLVQLALDRLPLRYFAPYLPDDVVVTGSVSASGELAVSPEGVPRAELALETSSTRIGSRGRTAVPGLRFEPGRVGFAYNGERLDVEVALPLERGQGGIDASAVVMLQDDGPVTASDVAARLRASLHDLRFVSDLVSGVEETTGTASMDVNLSGTIAAPQLAGRIALEDGSVRLRAPGITLEDVQITVEGDGSGEVQISGAATSGEGTLLAEGRLGIESAQPVGRLTVRGEEFELANIPDARVWVSPDLRFDLAPNRLNLTGRVAMPRARFTPREAVEGAVTVSDDQVIVDAEVPRRARLDRPFYARVELVLGDDVRFDGFGLTARLGGALEIIEAPQEPVVGSGELRVQDGTYQAYGQELEVRTGRLLFAGGALARPGLDIEAVRRPTEDILVGARVRGTLDRPELSVFSEPIMSRQEQLSYLLLGRPLENTSTSETSALSQAALALGLRGGNFVSERLNETLGFDTFGIQSQPAEANSASFVIGKYLTPSLYVSYGVGLFEPVNTLRLRYTISSRWQLVTESSTVASGGDLIYNIERR